MIYFINTFHRDNYKSYLRVCSLINNTPCRKKLNTEHVNRKRKRWRQTVKKEDGDTSRSGYLPAVAMTTTEWLLSAWPPLQSYATRVENRVTEGGQRSKNSGEVDRNSPICSPRPPPRRAPDESPAGREHRRTRDAPIMSLAAQSAARMHGFAPHCVGCTDWLFIFSHSYQLTAFKVYCFLTWFPNRLACSTVQTVFFFFCFNISLQSKCWLHNVMARE